MKQTVLINALSWTEFEVRMLENDEILLPAGMLEQHGRHNPLGTDIFIAEECARRIGERTGALVAPAFPYGCGPEGRGYPGQVSLSPFLLRKIWRGYCDAYARHGAKRFLFINGHAGNAAALRMVANDLYRAHDALCAVTEWWTTVPHINPELECMDHGGLYETSCVMAVNESIVHIGQAQPAAPDVQLGGGISYGLLAKYKDISLFLPADDYRLMKPGNLGLPPADANPELGRRVLDAYVDFNVGLLTEMRRVNL